MARKVERYARLVFTVAQYLNDILNIADKLTKIVEFNINTVGLGLQWNEGLPWIKLPTDQLIASLNSFEKVDVIPEDQTEFNEA